VSAPAPAAGCCCTSRCGQETKKQADNGALELDTYRPGFFRCLFLSTFFFVSRNNDMQEFHFSKPYHQGPECGWADNFKNSK
jgi:hypothetical protein